MAKKKARVFNFRNRRSACGSDLQANMTMLFQVIQARLQFRLLVLDIECLLVDPGRRYEELKRLTAPQHLQEIGDS
jgi:hypothetical protein